MPGHYGGSSSGRGSPHAGTAGSSGSSGGHRGGGADRDPQPVSRPTYTPPARHHAVDTPTQVQEQKVADEINRQNEMRDLIVQQQQEKDYIDIIDRNYATDFDETPQATLEGQLKLDEYQEPSGILDSAVGLGLNMILPGAGYLYNLESNPYKASNFFAGTGIQDLDRQALLSGYLSPEDAAAYQAGTYGQPTGGGEGVQPTVIGGGGPDVMPITMAQVVPEVVPTGINTIPVDPTLTAGYTDQQDFMDNVYRQNLLDFFKGTGYTGLYG